MIILPGHSFIPSRILRKNDKLLLSLLSIFETNEKLSLLLRFFCLIVESIASEIFFSRSTSELFFGISLSITISHIASISSKRIIRLSCGIIISSVISSSYIISRRQFIFIFFESLISTPCRFVKFIRDFIKLVLPHPGSPHRRIPRV